MIIILFILLVLLIPIPVKFTLHFSHNDYYIKLYRVNLYSKKGGVINKIIAKNTSEENKSEPDSNKRSAETTAKSTNKLRKSIITELSIKKLFKNLKRNKLKPSFKFTANVDYSLNDASLTSISYGVFCNINPLLYGFLRIFFNIKKFKFHINPKVTSPILLNITITSIITFNLVQIIHMLLLLINSKIKIEEANPV